MFYTVRYAHLETVPGWIVGDRIIEGNIIGRMGNSGASAGAHLHIDCVEDVQPVCWSLKDMETSHKKPAFKQLNWFIDEHLFNTDIEITTHFNDPDYMIERGKVHLAYDVVPQNRHLTNTFFMIHWNRSKVGTVVGVGTHPGYGNYLLVSFEA